MKLKHRTLIGISGVIWMGIGLFLLTLGLNYLVQSSLSDRSYFFNALSWFIGVKELAIVALMVFALFLGSLKAKTVFGKVVVKNVKRIRSFPNPTEFTNIYGFKYFVLIAFMMFLGVVLRYFEVPLDIRGVIDVAVGSALVRGGIFYFRNLTPLEVRDIP